MSLYIQKRERPIIELIREHADKVLETVGAAREAFEFYLDGNAGESSRLTEKIHECEKEADAIEWKVEIAMFGGAFMPSIREALTMIFKKMDIEKFSHRMMLREMILHISEVMDRMEDASEKLDVIALRLKS